jgi:TNF receptor-associated factor 4
MCKLSVKQAKEIGELQAVVKHCKPFNQGQLLWKIEKFSACLETAKEISGYEIHSPPFYTDQYGYKFMIVAFPNGNGSGEGTHLSLYVRLLVGEYDSLLKWPFLGDITLTLIEQSSDSTKQRHISQNFSPDPKWTSFHRPKKSTNTPGFGYPQFASHETLRARKYIVDDAIFIRATVELPQIIEA